MPRTLGIDYGERRVGLAVSDPDGILATVLRVENVRSEAEGVEAVRTACVETGAERIVIGLPLTLRGTHGPMAVKVQAFARAVETATGIPVKLWDERFSTAQVERTMRNAELGAVQRKGLRDKLAAQVTLQCFLDAEGWAAPPPPDGDGE